MKSERRHELQHNALLDWLMQTGEKIKPHVNVILLGVVVVLVGLVGYKVISGRSADKEAVAWDSVFSAMGQGDTAQLEQTVQDHKSTIAAQWAAVVAGDMQLSAGCEDLFTTKATAVDQFQKAQEKYSDILEYSREPVIRERATYGLARAYEAMAGTRQDPQDLKRAKEEYQKVVDGWPEGAYAKAAQSRLNALSQTSTNQFYDALAAWEPRPPIASPAGLENLNIPFDESGKGLNVGEKPEGFFDDITNKIDKSTEGAASDMPAEDAGQAAEGTAPVEPPVLPEASGDSAAEKTDGAE